MTVSNYIGYTLYASATLPVTNDAAGFEALTWVEIGGLIQGPQFGFTHAQIDVPNLKSGITTGIKGAGSGVDTQIQCSEDIDGTPDAGQVILKTQGDDDDGFIALKLGKGTGTDNALQSGDWVQYCQGFLHSLLPNQPTNTSHEGFTVQFRANAKPVTDTEPV